MSESLKSAFAALERWAQEQGEENATPIMLAQARAMMIGYHARWGGSEWRLEVGEDGPRVEEEFLLPISDPDGDGNHEIFQHAGKLDGVVLYHGKRYLLEHKTASEDISDPNSAYWRRLAIDAQISAYTLAQWQQGQKLDGTLYDVLRKPTIRPRQLRKKDIFEITNVGSYFGLEVSGETASQVSGGELDAENIELYELRLTRKYTEEANVNYQRKTVARVDRDTLEFSRELWQLTKELEYTRANDAHYRNSGACMQWGSACEYLPLCSGFDSPDSERWRVKEQLHTELPLVSAEVGASRDVLTYSRMQCYKLCKRKHQYRYEIGLERVDKQDSEALRFGSLIHAMLEAWWRGQ